LREVDIMRKETHQLILSFRPNVIRTNPRNQLRCCLLKITLQ
jgi:hypothetical protein